MDAEIPRAPGFDQVERGGESVLELHRAQLRERPEPVEGGEPVPWWLWAIAAVTLFSGGFYLGRYNAGFTAEAHRVSRTGSPWTAPAASALPSTPPEHTGGRVDLAKEGASVFSAHCAVCHQATGAGIPGVFPPLANSPWVLGSDTVMVKIVLLGLQGPVVVGGVTYQGQMPTWRASLSDQQIAAVASYVRSSWGNKAGPVTAELVAQLRQSLATRDKPWSAAELR
jgi:mono/diheme cytochrome c family protein